MKRLRAERKRTEAGRKIIRDRKIINASSDESIVLWENKKHVRAYRKRLKKKNPEKHHMNKLKDRVRKRKKLYASYTLDKKITRITQRVIYAVYVKHYNNEESLNSELNPVFDADICFPDIVQMPDCCFYLYKEEIDFFKSYYEKNPSEKSSRWCNAIFGRWLVRCADEVMSKLQTLKDECALWRSYVWMICFSWFFLKYCFKTD